MLAAKDRGEDQVAAVERSVGWERLKTLVSEAEAAVADNRPDNLGEVVERYASVRRMSPVVLGAFSFRSWKDNDSADRPQETRYPALQPPSAPDPTPRRCSDLPKPFSAINRNPQSDRLLLCFYRY